MFGNINVTGNPLVVLRGNETLITPSGGQARVEALDGGLNFLDVSLAAAGTGFDSAVFNLNSPNGTPGTATITAFNQFGGSAPVPGPIVGAGLPGAILAAGGLLALARRRRQASA